MKNLKTLLLAATVTGFVFGPGLTFAQEAEETKVDPAQFARGAQAWADQCGRCHNIRAPEELNDADWYVSASHMRVRANIPGDIIRDIQAFLLATNDKKK